MRSWIWEIEKSRQGPDYLLCVGFASSDAAQLLDLARRNPPPHFSRVEDEAVWKIHRSQNRAHHEIFQYDKSQKWVGSLLEISDGSFWFERDFGGLRDESALIETQWALSFMADQTLSLKRWEVCFGGQGYSDGIVAQGASVEEFKAYLGKDAAQKGASF